MNFNFQPISNIMNRNTKYVIPGYQRSYKWTKDNVEEFLQDVWSSCECRDKAYFLGSIICCTVEKDGQEVYEIVDGQQRLITITLVMRQLIELVDDAGLKEDLALMTFRTQGTSGSETKEPILEVRKKDKNAFASIIQGGVLPKRTKGVEKKFVDNVKAIIEFFQKELKGSPQECNKFGEHLIQKVRLLQVITGGDRSFSFRLFEVLNNRGMSLSATDLLKNELMEKAHKKGTEREKRVEEQWENLEKVVQEIGFGQKTDKVDDEGKSLGMFFSALQISEKRDRDRVRINIYKHYAQRLKDVYGGDSATMIDDILKGAQRFCEACEDDSTKKTMSFLMGFHKNTTEWAPAIMAFLNNKNYDRNRFPEFVELLEKLYMQKWLVSAPTSKREAPSYYAVEAINTGKSVGETMDVLHKIADNKAVTNALNKDDFYDSGAPAKINFIKWVLLRLNSKMGDTDVDTVHTGQITIEHILPNNKSNSYWNSFTKEQHEEWLHKIGNLTVISRSKNAVASNDGFDEKREVYKTSDFIITRKIAEEDKWGMEQLQDRHAKLIKEIEDLWLVKNNQLQI